MFRPLRRKSKELSKEDTEQLLLMEGRGVFAVNGDDGYPFAIPVNYYYDSDGGKIYFHGAKAGHKIDALKKCDKVCFTVYGNEFKKEGEWAPFVQSAVVFGRCALVEDPDIAASQLRKLAEKYYPDENEIEVEFAKDFKGVQLYEISIEHMCGKQIQEK